MGMEQYEDMLQMPHPISTTRERMSERDRAAQFAPFAALTGFDGQIKETARQTDFKIELDESEKEKLNRIFQILHLHQKENPRIEVEFFQPDLKKTGGEYISFSGHLKKIDTIEGILCFMDGEIIPIDDIISVKINKELEKKFTF